MTLGEFHAKITVDGHSYDILIQVVSDDLTRNALLIGRNFLEEVDLRVKRGEATISPCDARACENDVLEICRIDAFDDCEVNPVDIASTDDEEMREVLRDSIDDYRAKKTREVDVKMTILLKDEEPVYQTSHSKS